MKKERRELPLVTLLLNAGQLDWLPKNPRQWTQTDIDRTAASIREDPDFPDDRPLLVTPKGGSKWIVFAGNLRHEGSKAAGLERVPCVVYYPETDEDRETIKRRAMKDNGSFGSWDFDALANEWDDLPLTDWGIPAWNAEDEKGGTFEPTIEDGEREGADYENAKMVFQFTAQEFAFVSDALAGYDSNKEAALLRVLGYEGSAEK
jgi:hypothetical protein